MGGPRLVHDVKSYYKLIKKGKNKGLYECSTCGHVLKDEYHIDIHVTKHILAAKNPCPGANEQPPNICFNEDHPNNECHIATESGYISYFGVNCNGEHRWICNICGGDFGCRNSFEKHNRKKDGYHQLKISYTSAEELRKEVLEARKNFIKNNKHKIEKIKNKRNKMTIFDSEDRNNSNITSKETNYNCSTCGNVFIFDNLCNINSKYRQIKCDGKKCNLKIRSSHKVYHCRECNINLCEKCVKNESESMENVSDENDSCDSDKSESDDESDDFCVSNDDDSVVDDEEYDSEMKNKNKEVLIDCNCSCGNELIFDQVCNIYKSRLSCKRFSVYCYCRRGRKKEHTIGYDEYCYHCKKCGDLCEKCMKWIQGKTHNGDDNCDNNGGLSPVFVRNGNKKRGTTNTSGRTGRIKTKNTKGNGRRKLKQIHKKKKTNNQRNTNKNTIKSTNRNKNKNDISYSSVDESETVSEMESDGDGTDNDIDMNDYFCDCGNCFKFDKLCNIFKNKRLGIKCDGYNCDYRINIDECCYHCRKCDNLICVECIKNKQRISPGNTSDDISNCSNNESMGIDCNKEDDELGPSFVRKEKEKRKRKKKKDKNSKKKSKNGKKSKKRRNRGIKYETEDQDEYLQRDKEGSGRELRQKQEKKKNISIDNEKSSKLEKTRKTKGKTGKKRKRSDTCSDNDDDMNPPLRKRAKIVAQRVQTVTTRKRNGNTKNKNSNKSKRKNTNIDIEHESGDECSNDNQDGYSSQDQRSYSSSSADNGNHANQFDENKRLKILKSKKNVKSNDIVDETISNGDNQSESETDNINIINYNKNGKNRNRHQFNFENINVNSGISRQMAFSAKNIFVFDHNKKVQFHSRLYCKTNPDFLKFFVTDKLW